MQQNKNQQLDAKFRKFIKVLIMELIYKNMVYSLCVEVHSIVFPIIDFHTQFL